MYNHIRNIWFFDILRWIYINIKYIIYTYTMTRITNIDLIYTTIIISSCYCTWENSHIHIYNVFKIIWSSITSTRSVASFHTRIACKLLVCMMYINKSVCLFYEQRVESDVYNTILKDHIPCIGTAPRTYFLWLSLNEVLNAFAGLIPFAYK